MGNSIDPFLLIELGWLVYWFKKSSTQTKIRVLIFVYFALYSFVFVFEVQAVLIAFFESKKVQNNFIQTGSSVADVK